MLKIGEFSELSQVTVKTLHHYDRLGLFHPANIDPFTNYRYYTLEQLPRIHRIMALKELGLSLEQIAVMLDENVPTEQIRGMLRLRQGEIEQEIREAQRRQAMIEFRLRMIEAETEFPNLDVVLKRLEPMRFLSFFVPRHATEAAAMKHMVSTVAAVNKAISEGTIKHTGVAIDVYHGETILPFESPEVSDGQHEVLLSVDDAQGDVMLDGVGPWKIRDEPAVETAATLMLPREDSNLGIYEKVTLLRRWAVAQGYKPYGYVRYLHHRGPLQTLNRDEYLFEAQLPVDVTDQ